MKSSKWKVAGRRGIPRRRPGEAQREQKEATRQKILKAAHGVFEAYSYTTASIDMIVEAAGVSRTTFYRHFDGKLAVALALFAPQAPRLHAKWKELSDILDPSLSDIRAWLTCYVAIAIEDPVRNSVLQQVEVTEPNVDPEVLKFHETTLRLIWRNEAGSRAGPSAELRARSLLLLLQLDQLMYVLCVRRWEVDHDVWVDAMAGLVYEFWQLRNRVIQGSEMPQLTKRNDRRKQPSSMAAHFHDPQQIDCDE